MKVCTLHTTCSLWNGEAFGAQVTVKAPNKILPMSTILSCKSRSKH